MHPQTIFDSGTLTTLQNGRTGAYQSLAKVLKGILDRYKNGTTLQSQQPNVSEKDRYEGIAGYAIGALIYGGQPPDTDYGKYLNVAKQSLLAMTYRSDLNDLQQAAFVRNLAIGYDVLSAVLGDAHFDSVCQTNLLPATENLLNQAQVGFRDDYGNNHNWVDYSAIGLAGYALQGYLPGGDHRADDWIALALANSQKIKAIQDLITDGSWHEGIEYLDFGLVSSMPFWLTAVRNGQAPDDTALLRALGRYILTVQAPGNPRVHVMTHGDWNWVRPGIAAVLRHTATRFRDGLAQAAADRWNADTTSLTAQSDRYEFALHTALHYVAYDPGLAAANVDQVPRDLYAEDQEAVIMRTGWGPDSVAVALKSGVFGGRGNSTRVSDAFHGHPHPNDPGGFLNIGHDHVDDLSIWVHGKGGWYLTETPGYNCCTAGDEEYYTTQWHNSFLIDGAGQIGDDRNNHHNSRGDVEHDITKQPGFLDREAHITLHQSTKNYAFARGDGSRLYPSAAGVQQLLRTVVLARDGYVALRDRVSMNSAHQVDQLFHFQHMASYDGAEWIRGDNDVAGHTLGVRVFAPGQRQVTVSAQHSNRCTTLSPSCVYDQASDSDSAAFQQVKVRPQSPVSGVVFLELLWPTDDWQNRPANASALNTGNPELGFRLPIGGGEERWIFSTGSGTQAGGLVLQGGEIGIVRADAAGAVQRLVLLGQGSLSDQRGVLIENPTAGVIEVEFTGTTADLSGTRPQGLRFYGPNVTSVTSNGQGVSFTRDGRTIVVGSVPTPGVKVYAGSTVKGQTAWQDYMVNGVLDGIYVDVDTSAAGFSKTPVYTTSIGGDSRHWATTGGSAVYSPTATGFRIYVRWSNDDAHPPDSQAANNYGWYINWIGVEL